MVVAFDELADLVSGLLKALEVMEVQTLLFERTDEALGDKTVLGSTMIDASRFILCYIRI